MDALLPVCIAILLVLAAANHLVRRDWLYPATLQSGLWAAVVAAYWLLGDSLPALSWHALVPVVFFCLVFSFGAYFGSIGGVPNFDPARPEIGKIDRLFLLGSLLVAAGCLPLFAATAWEYAANDYSGNPLINVRFALTHEGKAYGPLAYVVPISMLAAAIAFAFLRSLSGAYAAVATTVAFVYSVLWTGRTFLFLLALLIFGILLMQRRISPLKALASFVAVGFLLFSALGIFLGKGGSLYEDATENLRTIVASLVEYALTPLAAFERFVATDLPLTWGANTFRTFWAIVAALRFDDINVLPLVKEFVYVPSPINVYTVFQPYYADFGVAGVVSAALVLGTLHGYIYKNALRGDPVWTILYGVSLFPLFMQFFQDQYFSLASMWLQYFAAIGTYAVARNLYQLRLHRMQLLRPAVA